MNSMEIMPTGSLEFRGIVTSNGNNGTNYYLACETQYNDQVTLYLGKSTSLIDNLNIEKGDMIDVLFDYDFKYKNLKIVRVSVQA